MKYHCRPDGTSVNMGILDNEGTRDTMPQPKEHIFLAEKSTWWRVDDAGVNKHAGFPMSFQNRLADWEQRGKPTRKDVAEIHVT